MDEVDQLANRLHSAAIHLLRGVARADAESGLSPARLSALSVIVYGGPLTMSALAEAERVSNATITSTVSGLERDGLAVRARGLGDARVVTVEATGAGRALMARARARRLETLTAALAGTTEAERSALATSVSALERILGETPH